MRGAIRLGAVTPIVVLGILAWTQAALLAQSPKGESPKLPPTLVPTPPTTAPFGTAGPANPAFGDSPAPIASAQLLDASPIRQRFLELSKKRARALTEEQLKHEIEMMEKEVNELEAWAKAEHAVRMLHEVVEKHPNTKAAEAANGAIRLIQEQRAASIQRREDVFEPKGFEAPPNRGSF
jgi:ribosomal protein L31E